MSCVARPLIAATALALMIGVAAAQSPEPEKVATGTVEPVKAETVAPAPAASDAPIETPAPTVSTDKAPEPQPAVAVADPAVPTPGPAPAPAPVETVPEVAPSIAATDPQVQPPVASPTIQPPAAVPPKPAFALDMAAAIARLPRAAIANERDRAALTAFYAERQGAPHWMSPSGRTANANALIAEIRRAGEWGLEAGQFDLPSLKNPPARSEPTPEQLAAEEAEIAAAVLKYARHARGGRLEPAALTSFLDRKPAPYEPRSVLARIVTARDPAGYLRDLHPHHPQFERLRLKYAAMRRAGGEAGRLARVPDGPKLEPGATHAHVALVRARLGVTAGGGSETTYDGALVDAVKAFQATNGIKPANGAIANGTRSALNGVAQGNPRKLLANMEQWRWMPDDLGQFYVWVNVPEYTIRVVSHGKVVHTERVVVGKIDTQTPIFSDEMEQVIFHPFWGVPESIKLLEVLPSLKGNGSVLAKHNLRIQSGGRDIDPKSVNWNATDIRKFHVYQPPGGDNVLGVVKFRFPNKHDVYMHDTPSKSLFQAQVRTFSHGCMRVQNPVRLAEILLAEDRKMASDKVRSLTALGAPQNNQVNLSRKIPVHITYFTASVEDDGRARYFNDIYGHEERISLGLEGKAHLIQPVPEPKGPQRAEPVASLRESGSVGDWVRRVFGNN